MTMTSVHTDPTTPVYAVIDGDNDTIDLVTAIGVTVGSAPLDGLWVGPGGRIYVRSIGSGAWEVSNYPAVAEPARDGSTVIVAGDDAVVVGVTTDDALDAELEADRPSCGPLPSGACPECWFRLGLDADHSDPSDGCLFGADNRKV